MLGELLLILRRISELRANFLKYSQESHFLLQWPCMALSTTVEASFEVYYISVSQKLAILGISPQIFFILTLVTSDTSWGQSMSLSNLNEVSNFSWGCQLSYETLSVRSVSKLELPETTISHRVILDPPRLLNWPKSPHRLGLRATLTFQRLL